MAVKSLGQWFRRRREKRGLSAAKLSKNAGLSHGYVSALERGRAIPKDATVADLARAMGMDIAGEREFHRLAILAKLPTWAQKLMGKRCPR